MLPLVAVIGYWSACLAIGVVVGGVAGVISHIVDGAPSNGRR